MKNKEFLRAVKFTLFSISAGVIEMGSFAIFGLFIPSDKAWLSQLLSQLMSILWNFTLNRKFTFQSASNVPVAMLKVLAFYVVFTPSSAFVMDFLTKNLQWERYIVKIMLMLLNFVLEFFYQRFFVFKNSLDTAKK